MPPFVSFTNVPQPVMSPNQEMSGSPAQSQGTEEKSGGLINDKVIGMLAEHGLPSDVNKFLENIDTFFSGNSLMGSSSANQYRTLIRYLNTIRNNKQQYDNAIDTAKKKNALSEIAIDVDGRVITIDAEGKMSKKLLNQVDREYEHILTVGEVAESRAYNDSMAFNTNVATIINNSTSMDEINKNVWDIITKLESSSYSGTKYLTKAQEKAAKGVRQLTAEDVDGNYKTNINDLIGDGPNGVYKVKEEGKSQNAQINHAMSYILSTLPANQRTLLRYYAANSGLGDNGEAVILTNMIRSGTGESRSITPDFDSSATTALNGGSSSTNKMEVTPMMQYQSGIGGRNTTVNITPRTDFQLIIPAQSFSQPIGADRKPIPQGSLETFFNQGVGSISDISQGVYFGNQRVDPSQYNQVMQTSTELKRGNIPVTTDEYGGLQPDLGVLMRMDTFYREYKELERNNGKVPVVEMQALIDKNNLQNYVLGVNEKGEIQYNNFTTVPMLMVDGYAAEDTSWFGLGPSKGVVNSDVPDTDRFITDIDDDRRIDADAVKAQMETLGMATDLDRIYKGTIFIPLSPNGMAQSVSGQNPIRTGTGINNIDIQQRRMMEAEFRKPDSANLWQ